MWIILFTHDLNMLILIQNTQSSFRNPRIPQSESIPQSVAHSAIRAFHNPLRIFPKASKAQNGTKPSSQSPNSANTSPKGGNRPWRIFLAPLLQNGFSEHFNHRKWRHTMLSEPSLRQYEPERGETDPGASF